MEAWNSACVRLTPRILRLQISCCLFVFLTMSVTLKGNQRSQMLFIPAGRHIMGLSVKLSKMGSRISKILKSSFQYFPNVTGKMTISRITYLQSNAGCHKTNNCNQHYKMNKHPQNALKKICIK